MQAATGGPERDILSRDEAAARSQLVGDVSYELTFELAAGSDTYDGRAIIEFELLEAPSAEAPLFVDFTGSATSIDLDGVPSVTERQRHRVWLRDLMTPGRHRLEISYRNHFDVSGDGFHRFVDPEDGAEYLYSNLEPFSAHRLFPCFDQPDVKASYAVEVVAPADWTVVSAEVIDRSHDEADGRVRHTFAITPRFATYLLPLVAGPWERIGGSAGDVRLGLYGRRSMRRELERSADELLELTQAGIGYYEELFGQPFPFSKYDQLFVPEFNSGAMENVGAVTFHDSYLFRDPPTYGQRIIRGEVVLHELAHMWFGNLVTMRWWDDLWLNETFATYASYRCLADATRFSDAWAVFNGQMRPIAYRQDQRSTTHPVAADVRDTDEAIGNFDGITYEKGAAVIKQLVAMLGDEAVRTGLSIYFERHAWGNATLADFLVALGDAAGRSLDEWAMLWLRMPSLNTIGVDWTVDDGRIDAMELWQEAPAAYPTLRPHTLSIGVVTDPGSGHLEITPVPERIATERVDVGGSIGIAGPLFVYPNHGDHDYALTRLDEVSLDFALQRLPDLPDPLLRQQVWSTLWQMVRDADLSALDFLAAVERFGPGEVDRGLAATIASRAVSALDLYVPASAGDGPRSDFVGRAIDAMTHSSEDDLRTVWARAAIAAASAEADLERLLELMDGTWSIDGFALDQDMRWSLVIKAVAHGFEDAAERLERESSRDGSDRGARAQVRAGVSRPLEATKQEAWDRIHGDGYGSDYLTRAAMTGFQWGHQRELLTPFREPFFERVQEIFRTRDHSFARGYARLLVPDRWAEPDVVARLRAVATMPGEDELLLQRQLTEIADDMERAITAQAAAARSS